MVKIILAFTIFLSGSFALAKQRDFHATVGFGTNFSFPGTVRLGYSDWEAGMLTQNFIGFDKVFDLTDSIYTAFGFGVRHSVGFYAALGFNYSFWKIGLRGELTSTFDVVGAAEGTGMLGVTYGF